MKHIVKNREPQRFSNWKRQGGIANRRCWSQVMGPIKQVIHDALMNEQGHICCYCESPVARDDSHVEHFRPRSQFPSRELDYQNLHCSCLRQLSKGEPRHCGHGKADWFDAALLISPLQQNCGRRFKFNGNGEIRPRNPTDSAAEETIKRLGLDLPKLNSLRKAVLSTWSILSQTKIRALLVRGTTGFPAYFTTIEDVLL